MSTSSLFIFLEHVEIAITKQDFFGNIWTRSFRFNGTLFALAPILLLLLCGDIELQKLVRVGGGLSKFFFMESGCILVLVLYSVLRTK